MDARRLVRALDFIEKNRALGRERGMATVETSNDFNAFRTAVESIGEQVSEHFDDSYIDCLSQNAIWICGRDEANDIVAICAMRCDDLNTMTLEEHLKTQLPRLNGGIAAKTSPGPGKLTGKTVYSGQFWVRKSFQKARLARAFSKICMAMALLKWNPSVIYGLTKREFAMRGLGQQLNFPHGQLHAYDWEELPRYLPNYFFCWITLEDLHWMIDGDLATDALSTGIPQTNEFQAQIQQAG